MANEPKKGTGKKPKGSSRRLYTDENPKDTVSVKFSSRQDIVDTLNKASFKSKPHARQSQIINLIHQRVRAAYGRAKDPAVKKRLKTALDYAEQRKEASKKKTERLRKQKSVTEATLKLMGKKHELQFKWIERDDYVGCDVYAYLPIRTLLGTIEAGKLDNGDWKVINVTVKPEFQGQGLGTILYEQLFLKLKDQTIHSDNTINSKAVHKIWKKMGAEKIRDGGKVRYVLKAKNENIDPAAQKRYGGKSAPFGSAYELVKELVLQELKIIKELKCKHGTYFCPHDKVYKCRKSPKKSRSNEGVHDPMNPGILKKRLGSLSCSKVRAARGKLKDKGTTYAKALQRYLNYHCQ